MHRVYRDDSVFLVLHSPALVVVAEVVVQLKPALPRVEVQRFARLVPDGPCPVPVRNENPYLRGSSFRAAHRYRFAVLRFRSKQCKAGGRVHQRRFGQLGISHPAYRHLLVKRLSAEHVHAEVPLSKRAVLYVEDLHPVHFRPDLRPLRLNADM
ncbi:hypothetical protein BGX30_005323, partial [Mortierella sp. GBA39]